MIRINGLELTLDEDKKDLAAKAAAILNVEETELAQLSILKESLDARKEQIKFVYSIAVMHKDEAKILKKNKNINIMPHEEYVPEEIPRGSNILEHRPVIVGFGPSGLFAALKLAKAGYRPLVLERGEAVENRHQSVDHFMKTGRLNTESNIQFGEGGAGTYSDGKLTTRIKDMRVHEVVKGFLEAGAPEEIAYMSKPHIGTDLLKGIVMEMRKKIISLGGEVRFNTKLEDIIIKNNKVVSIVASGEEIPCNVLILALGHSARDTYEMIFNRGFSMIAKSLAVGVRVENAQWRINESQYGKDHRNPKLSPAEYALTSKSSDGRGIYSFCMCPGGIVVPAASEQGMLAVNGMSNYKRDGANANSAVVVSVTPKDFGDHPLDGIRFQRDMEKKAFLSGGANYFAPCQRVEDFLVGKTTKRFGGVLPTYTPGTKMVRMDRVLPKIVSDALKTGFLDFDRKIEGFARHGAIITGVETRTSSPLRILRGDNLESVNIKGAYPIGEGAGYAGGIVSSAVDGIKLAEEIIKTFKPFD